MGKKERQAMRMLGMESRKSKPGEKVVSFGFPFAKQLKMDWYLTNWFEKLVFLLGGISLFYSIIRIFAQGFW